MPLVIPFFIPHQGCPHQCLFCNQRSITGAVRSSRVIEDEIASTITEWLRLRRRREATQFAFYGGSFTCLPLSLQQSMLEVVQPWLMSGEIDCIRLSTRPDCIDTSSGEFLRRYGVRLVELGMQSLDSAVLEASLRGHSVQDCIEAVGHLQRASLEVGIQLMPGLPGESRLSFMRTVKTAVSLRPAFLRLYPVVVVNHSGLADMYKKGEYVPLTLNMAVVLTAWARRLCRDAGVRVVRMGLQPSESLEKNLVAGPYHPAFGELVLSREWLRRTRRILAAYPGEMIKMTISARDVSAFIGSRKSNRTRLKELGLWDRLSITADKNMERGMLKYVVGKSA
jgi:histone acetyltransferase (RNA polymerase elongator complex component)